MEATTMPVIDLARSTTHEGLLLNVEAELTIRAHRDLMHARANRDFADRCEVRVRVGFDFTPHVGWHTSDPPPPCKQPVFTQSVQEPVRWHGDFDSPGDEGFDDEDGVYTAVFTDVRTGAQTYVTDQGEVPVGNALDAPPPPHPRRRRTRPIFAFALPPR